MRIFSRVAVGAGFSRRGRTTVRRLSGTSVRLSVARVG